MNVRELVKKRSEQGRKLFKPAKFLALKRGKKYPKKHGSVFVYTDKILEVRYDDYGANLSVRVNGQRVLDFHLGHITSFIPDTWVGHLQELAAPILAQEELRIIERQRESEAKYLEKWGIK